MQHSDTILSTSALDHQIGYAFFKENQQQLGENEQSSDNMTPLDTNAYADQQMMVHRLFDDFQQQMMLPTTIQSVSSPDIVSTSNLKTSPSRETKKELYLPDGDHIAFSQNVIEHPFKSKDYRFHVNTPDNPPVAVNNDNPDVPAQGYICINVPVMLPPLPDNAGVPVETNTPKLGPQVATVPPFLTNPQLPDMDNVISEHAEAYDTQKAGQMSPENVTKSMLSAIPKRSADVPSTISIDEKIITQIYCLDSSPEKLNTSSELITTPTKPGVSSDVSILKPPEQCIQQKFRLKRTRNQKKYPGLSSETKDKLEQKLQQKMLEKYREKQIMIQQQTLKQEILKQQKEAVDNSGTPLKPIEHAKSEFHLQQAILAHQLTLQPNQHHLVTNKHLGLPESSETTHIGNTSRNCIVIGDDVPLDLTKRPSSKNLMFEREPDTDTALDLVSQHTKQKRIKTGLSGMVEKLWENRKKVIFIICIKNVDY